MARKPTAIVAIDPGTAMSAYCVMTEAYEPIGAAKVANEELHRLLLDFEVSAMVIECMEPRFLGGEKSHGQMIGSETYETCIWIGRFMEIMHMRDMPVHRVYRHEERSMLIPTKRNKLPPLPAGTGQSADAQIRAALIQRFAKHDKKNGKGTAKRKDVFHGFKADMWNAFAVGVVHLDKQREEALRGHSSG